MKALRVTAEVVVGVLLAASVYAITLAVVVIARGDQGCRNGYVALTVDDGPTDATPSLLRTLRERDATATFFNMGSREQARPDLVDDIVRAGHTIGNHTYSHPDLTKVSEDEQVKEILGTSDIHLRRTGESERLFRPPFGNTDPNVENSARRLGLTQVLWTVDTHDTDPTATVGQVRNVASHAENGDVVLFHGTPQTVEALPGVLTDLDKRGLCTGRIYADNTGHWQVRK